jgi:hypothetical protein
MVEAQTALVQLSLLKYDRMGHRLNKGGVRNATAFFGDNSPRRVHRLLYHPHHDAGI